ncbi:MAG: ybgC [Rickettsiaceae bacterium]|jgi:acyl-CoA thioester hydrolase|nr:ybgC [Rickettsiaceae bacterium]
MLKSDKNSFEYRIYYEDTDSGGVVYYANYLKFFERARTDFLRSKNIIQSELVKNSGIIFVVRNCQIDYLKPAKMDDLVEIFVAVTEVRKASIQMKQEMKIGEKTLCKIEVEIACINAASFKPERIPTEILDKIN